MIVIVNYGVGNLLSVKNMIGRAGYDSIISSDPAEIARADKIVLPGVGKFDYGMQMIRQSNLVDVLNHIALVEKRPTLGICLGSQLLGKGSEEGSLAGLGWLEMSCKRLPASRQLRVPHMGWNQLSLKKESYILSKDQSKKRYYFVHSFYMDCEKSEDILATSEYGFEFVCAVKRNNIVGLQFHPEKSLSHGLSIMKAFARGEVVDA